jgi:hypothetical protein
LPCRAGCKLKNHVRNLGATENSSKKGHLHSQLIFGEAAEGGGKRQKNGARKKRHQFPKPISPISFIHSFRHWPAFSEEKVEPKGFNPLKFIFSRVFGIISNFDTFERVMKPIPMPYAGSSKGTSSRYWSMG